MTENLGNATVGLGDTVGGVTGTLGSVANGIIKAGPGAAITQGMADQAKEIKPSVDKANG
ncbi:hypothetical protein ACFWNI_04360 [Streptomyces sp. NPDC058377]|uniref:hypothetical protein n=1 Tax=Streptomyces sp. NPDC058377 TaxID=3346468 RepID=UPI0036660604